MSKASDPKDKDVIINPDDVAVLDLKHLVPKPRPEIFTLLGAAEAGIKSVREELEKEVSHQPNALMRITTVKAACISIEALLTQQVTDTMMRVQALAIANQLEKHLKTEDKKPADDNGSKKEKPSAYL